MKVKNSELSLTSIKSGFGAIMIADELLICGGNDGHSILRTFESYDFKTKKWNNKPTMKFKRDELAVAFGPDGKVYAIGGFGGPNK